MTTDSKTADWRTLRPHPLADELPAMSELEYEALKQDIGRNGLRQPIVLFEGRILDGRHRHRACVELGIDLRPASFEEFRGTEADARRRVASANLMRRHLSKSQKAMFAVMAGLVAPPAVQGKRRKYGTGRDSIMRVGKEYGVNHVTLYKAASVHAYDKELAGQVMEGVLSVAKAEAILKRRAVEKGGRSEVADAKGRPVPKSLVAAFAARQHFGAIEAHLRKAGEVLQEVAKEFSTQAGIEICFHWTT